MRSMTQQQPEQAPSLTAKSVATNTKGKEGEQSSSLFRNIKWEYMAPIIMTPVAHSCVSLIRKYPQHRTKLMYGVAAATFLTLQTRLILMYDAGYPGAEASNKDGLPLILRVLSIF